MRSRIFTLLIILLALMLTACGTPSKEDVLKKLSNKWNETKGYDLQATMEIKTGEEPRLYHVDVWHTKPNYYRVNVTQEGSKDSQMIVRNEDGVFVITPSLGKTYKFQSDWPAQNSQGYLIGTLSEDIQADANSTMKEVDGTYVFETVTRNNQKKVLPTQRIYIDKKTLLPTHVSILDEMQEEKIRITFKKITLGTARKASDYDVELKDSTSEAEEDEKEDDKGTEESASLSIYYPTVNWEGVTRLEEQRVDAENGKRSLMIYGGAKEFIIIQEPASKPESKLPVMLEGDPVDLGFTIAAQTDKSIRWESEGVSFFIASESLTKEEMIEVAASMKPEGMK